MHEEQITKIIEELSDKLGTTTEGLWNVLISQAMLDGIGNILIFIAFSIMFMAVSVVAYKMHNGSDLSVGLMLSVVLFIIYVFVFIFMIKPTITAFLNPEYFAFSKIFQAL